MALEKVWVVEYNDGWAHTSIVGIYNSPDLADTYVNDQDIPRRYNITEITINQEVK